MIKRAAIAAVLIVLALPAAAPAQQFLASGGGFFPTAPPISDVQIPASVTGELGVSFHSDPAGGCAALASCGFQGTIAWNPVTGGTLEVTRYKQGARTRVFAALSLGQGNTGPVGSLTAAAVQREVGGRSAGGCADEQARLGTTVGQDQAGETTLALADVLSPTRCAGPLAQDLADVLPSVRISTSALARGSARLDFSAERAFAAHGLAGTVTSTVVVTLGRPGRVPGLAGVFPPGLRPTRMRLVTERLKLSRIDGGLTAAVTGSANTDVCVLLDSCGVAGTITINPGSPTPGTGELVAIGPAARPYVDFLTALGLSRRGRSAGIVVTGSAQWGGGGTVASALSGPFACTDSAAAGGGAATLTLTGNSLAAEYVPAGASLRTRCPGPMLSPSSPLAAGRAARSALRRSSFSVVMHGIGPLSDEGYGVTVSGRLSLRLHRGPVSQRVFIAPSP